MPSKRSNRPSKKKTPPSGHPGQPSKAEKREAARQKAAAMREAEEKRARRRRTAIAGVTGVVVVALVVAVGLVIQSVRADRPDPNAVPQNTIDGAVVVGTETAPVTLDVYLDYQCPACRAFEAANASLLDELASEGDVAVRYFPIAILDSRLPGDASARAAGAAGCVADSSPDSFPAFNEALFVNQPEEGEGLSDDDLVRFARDAGAADEVEACITEGRYTGWAETVTSQAGVRGTPTVRVSGPGTDGPVDVEQWQSPDLLRAAVDGARG